MTANWARKDYGAYKVSWPGSARWKRRCGCGHRSHLRTTRERRLYDKEYGRKKRGPHRLPNKWDDPTRSDIEDRSWKRHRKTQYKITKMGGRTSVAEEQPYKLLVVGSIPTAPIVQGRSLRHLRVSTPAREGVGSSGPY